MLRLRRLALGGVAALMLSCGGGGGGYGGGSGDGGYGGGGGTPPAATIYVGNGGSMSFQPANLTVTAGTTVTWEWKSGIHDVTSGNGTPDGRFSSGAPKSSGTFTYKFDTPGSYPYYCGTHGAAMMSGTVTVN